MNRSLPLLPAIAAVLLAGCVSTGQYRAAPIAVASAYGRGDAARNTPEQALALQASYPAHDIAADAWWRGFGDARLDRMVQQALASNSDLAAAGLALRKARLQAGLAETELWPTASGSVAGSGSRATDRHDAFDRSYSASVSLDWEIDLWGKLRAQRDVAQWEAAATDQDRENTALALVGEVCSDYWQLAYLNQSIAAGEQNLQRLEKTLQLVQVQFGAGDVSRLELREAEQNLESQRTAQSALLQQRVEVRNAIAVLLDGQPWPQADEPQDLDAASSPALAAGVPAELLARRPDLRAAELRLRESLAQIKATARSYYPALSLTGAIGGSSTALSDVVRNPVATLGAGLTLPFLNLHRARLDTRIAGTDYEIAATQFRTTLYTALSEVDNALSAREQLAAQVESANRSYQAARDVERMYEVRYRSGASDLRTWLDAQQTLRESELALALARRQQLVADVTLYQALGGSAAELKPPVAATSVAMRPYW
ncbi:efflux transporter outer membrane subunit [Xanthomonas massiliensis]|uniref:efflux transporter outer membrane subunit n=1 Tax=Xanthomonas massiliensis TaxID=1720302 RepID=UPI0008250E6A|nr:efflux transporter outer membrane subunit [Xanthomonas massiliensis]